jgi:DNA phosphorothioation system restriction enzyme
MDLTQLTLNSLVTTSDTDIIRDFFNPALMASVRYDRGVGYFSADWLRITAEGMVRFAANNGRARWVTSPILSQEDWEALQQGEAARHDSLLRLVLARNIDNLEQMLKRETLSALAWLVADGILDFKLALPRNKLAGGEFHDKFGVFTDRHGNRVSFNGSYNESVQGTRNYESLMVFWDWSETFAPLVEGNAKRFEYLWENYDPNVQVFNLPEAARARILKLRTHNRPYPAPDWNFLRSLTKHSPLELFIPRLHVPSEVNLRDYQIKAVDAWFNHDCSGLFEMATGTGKTLTSLAAMTRLYERERRLATVIAVPYQHLVDQWQKDVTRFGLQPILAYQKKASWLNSLHQQILEFNRRDRHELCIITTHTTFIDDDFQKIIGRLNVPSLLIADEVHHLGAERSRRRLPTNIQYRLALSATPNRWFDDTGTIALRDYFGETVFQFTLEDAIRSEILTPYNYYPQLIELTSAELDEYQALSEQIAKLINTDDEDLQNALEMLLIKRARLLNNASEKLIALEKLVSEAGTIHHALFYCSPEQIDTVSQLLGWTLGLIIGRFTAEEPNDQRQQILDDFDKKVLQALVAMKCLDEGVDVPSTRTAFILASSSNPREFIQRRGRILRRVPGKTEATVYDFIAIPPQTWKGSSTFNAEKSIVEHELHRFTEFANSARNKHQALDVLWDIAKRYDIQI